MKENKNKNLCPLHEQRTDFTPIAIVYSVYGIVGREAKYAGKYLATFLTEKWKRSYPEMAFYVQVKMVIAVVRANNLLIRGSRDQHKPRHLQIADEATMYDWRVHHDG